MALPPEDNLFETGSNLMRQIYTAIIRLDSKADNLAERVADLIKDVEGKISDHEKRLRELESRPYVAPATMWKLLGAVTGLAGIALTIISITK